MNFRKIISLLALLVLMLGQVALVQHSAEHIDHGISFELVSSHDEGHSHDHHHNPEENKQTHQCPECVLNQSLQAGFHDSTALLFFTLQLENLMPEQQPFTVATDRYNANSPRAPPVILI